MIPAVALFDVVKGFRRRYLDLGGEELADQARDDLLILDSNRFQLPSGPGSLFRVARISSNPSFGVAAFGIYRSMPPGFQLRSGSYFGCALFADPKDLDAAVWTEKLEELSDELGKSIRSSGPERWDLRRYNPDLSRLGPEPNLPALPPAFDGRWQRSDESAFVILKGLSHESFLDKLQYSLQLGDLLSRYANVFFTFDEYLASAIVSRGQSNSRSPDEIFYSQTSAAQGHASSVPRRAATAILPQSGGPIRHGTTQSLAVEDDLLRSRPIRSSRPVIAPSNASIRISALRRFFAKYRFYASVTSLIAAIFALLLFAGFSEGWLSWNRRAFQPQPSIEHRSNDRRDIRDDDRNFGPDNLRRGNDLVPSRESSDATLPPEQAIEETDDDEQVQDTLSPRDSPLVKTRRYLAEVLADPALDDDVEARKLVEDFVARIDRHMNRRREK